jgi:succinate dehydrogenase/fumarate reductase flavoprotein subunit
MWQNSPVRDGGRGHVVVVGSGLAGLSAAIAAADTGMSVTVLTPGRAGRDGSSHRVHALAPWVLLSAPWVAGDGPARYLADLKRRGEGLQRDALAEVFAEASHEAAVDICETLHLAPLDRAPVVPPGETVARGLRCVPSRPVPLLTPLVDVCERAGVAMRARSLVVGLVLADGRVCGVVLWDREAGVLVREPADAVVLACGGVGAVFPRTTSPRWCRGSAVAIAGAAGALLHHPHLTQALPVTATPPLYFPTTAALLGSRIMLGDTAMSVEPTLDAATLAIAAELRLGGLVTLDPVDGDGRALLPPRVLESPTFRREGRVPLALAVHHGIGGVAIDTWGRTSLAGLYACGEAAGGVQGRRRLMGTGLLEARIFGLRAGRTAGSDVGKWLRRGIHEEAGRHPARAALPQLPADGAGLELLLDQMLDRLVCVRPEAEVASAAAAIEAWPVQGAVTGDEAAWLAALRRAAALAILHAECSEARPAPITCGRTGQGAR